MIPPYHSSNSPALLVQSSRCAPPPSLQFSRAGGSPSPRWIATASPPSLAGLPTTPSLSCRFPLGQQTTRRVRRRASWQAARNPIGCPHRNPIGVNDFLLSQRQKRPTPRQRLVVLHVWIVSHPRLGPASPWFRFFFLLGVCVFWTCLSRPRMKSNDFNIDDELDHIASIPYPILGELTPAFRTYIFSRLTISCCVK